MRFIYGLLLVIIILSACNEQVYIPLPSHDVFKFAEGDRIVYKSNRNEFDTLIVDSYKNYIHGYNTLEWNKYEYQHNFIKLHFKHDQHFIDKYHLLYDQHKDCKGDYPEEYCDSIYNPGDYFMYIRIMVESYPNPSNFFTWKKLPTIQLTEILADTQIYINEQLFKRVYIIERDASIIGSMIHVRRVYYNNEYGILKFENMDSSVFELHKPVQ